MSKLNSNEWIARNLARAFLRRTSRSEPSSLRELAEEVLGIPAPWLRNTLEFLEQIPFSTWETFDLDSLAQKILLTPGFDPPIVRDGTPPVRKIFLSMARMRPPPWALDVSPLPKLTHVQELAEWLGLSSDRLAWLTSPAQAWREHSLKRPVHYHYRLHRKSGGGFRLIEIPKADMKHAQQHILKNLLQQIPVHEATHGFVRGRSVLTHTRIHTGQPVVIHFDLQDFFPSVRAARIHAVWKTLGYPLSICKMLTALCTTRTASAVIERLYEANEIGWVGKKRLASPHLPQGAPTSPALANLCAFSLDVRLDGLAEAFGARYTRYADDLVFSGPVSLRHRLSSLQAWVTFIAENEGFALHPRKTRCMPQHMQQRITGVVVNHRENVPRKDFDQLKAQLHQCILHGPAAQNRSDVADFRNHLLGKIHWVGQFNAARSVKLMRLFSQIHWTPQEE